MPIDPFADRWQTPPSAAALIIPFLPPGSIIWEPACGDGRLLQALGAAGFEVYGTDILTGTDFLTATPPYTDATVIVTNPPFSQQAAWVKRCFALDTPWALLMPANSYVVQGIDKQPRWPEVRVVVPIGPRIACYRPYDYVGVDRDGNPECGPILQDDAPQQLVWYTWRLLVPNQLHYVDYAADQPLLFALVAAFSEA